VTTGPLEDITLAGVPRLGRLYAQGIGASARHALSTRRADARRLLPVAYVVTGVRADAEHLTAYQHLLGESASDRLPAGFVHVLAFPVATALMVRPGFPLPLVGLVHLANRIDQLRPVTLGDPLDVRAWAQHLAPHRSGTQVELVTEVRLGGTGTGTGTAPGAGPLAWRGVSTYLAKGTWIEPRDAAMSPAAATPARAVPAEACDGDRQSHAPFVAPAPTARWDLAADTGRRYADVSGDRNPIHLTAPTARLFGFPCAIAHGMYTAARALAEIGAARGDTFTWTVELATPVLLPSTVAVRVTRDADAFTYVAWNDRTGKPHLTGTVAPGV